MRLKIDSLALLLPALLVLLLWQTGGEVWLHPANIADADRLEGFSIPEENAAGTFRWGSAQARLALPATGLPGVLMLRGAVASGARVRVSLGTAPPVDLPGGVGAAQLRRYSMLLPASPDPLGWVDLRISADPAAHSNGRDLSVALVNVAIAPLVRGLRWPPAYVWLLAASLPALLAGVLALAGAPQRPATLGASLAGVGMAWLWAANPAGVYPWLLDLRAMLAEPLILRWWLATQLFGLAAWPLTVRLLRGLPMGGYPLTKTFGLLLIVWVAWMLASLGVAPFSLTSVVGCALLVAAFAWLPPLVRRRLPALPGWRGLLAYELLFLVALWAGVWLRWHGAVGPAITGTEKPMEIAIINALLRDGSFPPHDPWFAGFGLNYYYLGYVGVAALTLLSGVGPATGFNLGFALVVGLSSVGVAYAAHALVGLSPSSAGVRPGRSARAGVGLLALLGSLVLGSQTSALQLIVGSPLVRALDAGQLATAVAQRLAGANPLQLGQATPPSWAGPPFATISPATEPSFDWFTPSRAIYDDVARPSGGVERRFAISEFPSFSFYLGDLHPHILAMPFDLLALVVALGLVARPARARTQIVLAGILIGCLYCINSWDAPTYALLTVGALVLGHRRATLAWRSLLVDLGALAGAALLAALPFLLSFRPPTGAVSATVAALPILGRLAGTFGLAVNHTQIHSFLSFFGLFMLLISLLLRSSPDAGVSATPTASAIGYRLSAMLRSAGGRWPLLLLALALGPLIGFPLLFLLPLALLLAAQAWAGSEHAGEALAAWAAAVACLILLAPELVYIRDHMEGQMSRMISIFKFYYQAWVLLSIVAAYAVWTSLSRAGGRRMAWLWAPPAALLLAGALVYPLGLLRWAEPWRAAERSLDGFAFLARERSAELAAAAWMAENVLPDEVVLTGFCNSCDYEVVSRASAISGVPTLLGWMDGHERVWRSGYPEQLAEIAARERDIPAIYRASDAAAAQALLDHYRVRYIYLGPVERQLYGAGAAAFARELSVVFSQDDVQIYRIP